MEYFGQGVFVEYEPTISDYPLKESLGYTRLAVAAYQAPDSLGAVRESVKEKCSAWMCDTLKDTLAGGLGGITPPFELLDWIDDAPTSTQAFFAQTTDQRTVVLSVRGSQDAKDWELNFDLPLEPFEPFAGGTASVMCGAPLPCVQAGLLPSMRPLYEKLDKYIIPAFNKGGPTRKIIITGHSRGGAIAAVAFAYVLAKVSVLPMDSLAQSLHTMLFTLGQPRAGNGAFRSAVEARMETLIATGHQVKVWRVVNDKDIVPCVPYMWLGFRHFGEVALIAPQKDGSEALVFGAPLEYKHDAISPTDNAADGVATRSLVPLGFDVTQLLGDHMNTEYADGAQRMFTKYLDPPGRLGCTCLQVLEARPAPPTEPVDVEAPPGALGVVFRPGPDGYAVVKELREGSPLVGLVDIGAVVLAVDGEDTSKHSHQEIVDHLKSKIDSTRTLTVRPSA